MSALLLILLGFVLGVLVSLIGVTVLVTMAAFSGDDEITPPRPWPPLGPALTPPSPPSFPRGLNELSHKPTISSVRVSP